MNVLNFEPHAVGVRPSHGRTTVEVEAEGHWFQVGRSGTIKLSRRRKALRRLLVGLARHARQEPFSNMPIDQLVRVAWPDEELPVEVGRNRIHVAIWTLRKLGLRDVLLTRGNGYRLDPKATVLYPATI